MYLSYKSNLSNKGATGFCQSPRLRRNFVQTQLEAEDCRRTFNLPRVDNWVEYAQHDALDKSDLPIAAPPGS